MTVQITGRHIEVPASLKRYIESRVEKLSRYIDGITDVHVILSAEKHRHIAELNVHSRGNVHLTATEASNDARTAVTQALEKIVGQAKKRSDKRIHRKRRRASKGEVEGIVNVLAAERGPAGDGGPRIIESRRFLIKPLSVEEAVLAIEEEGAEFLVFRNAVSDRTNVLYRRPDGNYGLIDPEG